jgi:hypothetical protein
LRPNVPQEGSSHFAKRHDKVNVFTVPAMNEGLRPRSGFTINNRFRLELKVWGVRGSIASPQCEVLGFGGNTACCPDALGRNQTRCCRPCPHAGSRFGWQGARPKNCTLAPRPTAAPVTRGESRIRGFHFISSLVNSRMLAVRVGKIATHFRSAWGES